VEHDVLVVLVWLAGTLAGGICGLALFWLAVFRFHWLE